jgi:hypothetical protein
VNVYRLFKRETESPWQYAVFYNSDCEIQPGSAMNITGPVKTNASLYTPGSGGANNLTFSSIVHYATAWSIGYSPTYNYTKSTPAGPAGTTPTQEAIQPPQNANLLGVSGTAAGVSDGYHEIIDPPPTGVTDPLAATSNGSTTYPSERMYNQAGIKIVLTGANRSSPTVTYYDYNGNVSNSGTNSTIYNAIHSAVTTNDTLYDQREGQTEYLTKVDMNVVYNAMNNSSLGLQNLTNPNIIYVMDKTTDSTKTHTAVQLINGYAQPTGGSTVVTPGPLYILGDYNTATTSQVSSVTVPSDKTPSVPTQPYAAGYDPSQSPCSVMADAVTILSNAWTNANSITNKTNYTGRNANNTTVDCAILSGIVEKNSSNASSFIFTGGVENYPRLLEDWSGNYFTYYGSMVQLFDSKYATGIFQEPGTYYYQPVRQWYFNVNFYKSPPPGTFTVINYVKSRVFVQ